MPLQTSGAISLNDIHVEAGGTSGTTATINDSDIRALISKGSGATMSFNEWYGASASTSYTLGQGSSGSTVGFLSGSYGSLSPTTFDGVTVRSIGVFELVIKGGSTSYSMIVTINGSRSQNFFTSIQESSLGTLQTSAASSYSSSSSYSTWSWTLSGQPANWDGSGNLTVVMA